MRAKYDYRLAFAAIVFAVASASAPAVHAQTAADYRDHATSTGAPRDVADDREFFIATVHLDGNANATGDANHPPEPFPAGPLPAGGGLLLTPPAADGAWRVRAFIFAPRQVVVFQGDPVKLTFVGVQGPAHRIQVDGLAEIIELKRGQVKSVTIAADQPGSIGFRSLDRLPSMQGNVVVLPRP